ncbi:helix-turn-helix transcriptional regulator [Terrimonas rubra]|uniref:Helix-turn-helix transcriptional regulator n=1 Tax=Terrimonas rubra TaxID=1035890 RepID=A0ABW6ABD0_9BACT
MMNNSISDFIKYQRKRTNMTQEELAEKAGVGLRFIRDMEQGKESLRLDKVNQVLGLFGHRMLPNTETIWDPYDIARNYSNIAVEILLKNRTKLYGIILGPILQNGQIVEWWFIPNNLAKKYKETKDKDLLQTIEHNSIDYIKEQDQES